MSQIAKFFLLVVALILAMLLALLGVHFRVAAPQPDLPDDGKRTIADQAFWGGISPVWVDGLSIRHNRKKASTSRFRAAVSAESGAN
jgi:hypothetical protein